MKDEIYDERPAFLPETSGPRKPRIALMGEFSAGKSTLANLMIGTDPLPMQVVATQLPPVWISHGTDEGVIVDLSGRERPQDLSTLGDVAPEDVAYVRIQCEEDILQLCDIIDMPGISDPNMPSEVWERILPMADGVIWCSPSTQAWRQSEAAVWEAIEPTLRQASMLLLTRADMLVSERDRGKVLKRVKNEAGHLFAHVQMISLLQARDAADDEQLWSESGADEFVRRFLDIVEKLGKQINGTGHQASPFALLREEKHTEKDGDEEEIGKVTPRRPPMPAPKREASQQFQNVQKDPAAFSPKFS